MAQDSERTKTSDKNDDNPRSENKRTITLTLDDLDDVDKAMRDALGKSKVIASNVGESIRDTIKSVKATRDNVVMPQDRFGELGEDRRIG